MVTHIQINALLSARAEEFCRRFLPTGHKEGNEWRVGDVMGNPGQSLGVQLVGSNAGLWNDRAADQGGKLLDLLKEQFGGDYGRAADEARRFLGLPEFRPGHRNGEHAFDPLKHPFKRTETAVPALPVAAWPYHSRDGQVIGYACRFEERKANGEIRKDVMPLRKIDGHWRWKGWSGDEKRPIYGLHRLQQRPDAPVLIVEGEKTCDAAQKIFADCVCITWLGGSKAVSKVDWTPLTGDAAAGIPARSTPIVLWPDADAPGHQAMLYVRARIPLAVMVKLPKGLPEGWDLADTIPEDMSPRGMIDGALNPGLPPVSTEPFRLLGFTETGYVYGSNATGLITVIEASEHTEMNLQRIANDEWWMEHYPPAKGQMSADYRSASKDLIYRQHQIGFFDNGMARGRGCWIDESRVIFHAGDRLYIDGVETPLHKYVGKFLYPRRPAIHGIDLSDPLTPDEIKPFFELCGALRLKDPSRWWFLPGWIVCALVCGVLNHRPHFWLYGGRGSGKSYCYANIIAPMIPWALKALASTTEAGTRQMLGCDALAVLIDELETVSEAALRRHAAMFELMRQSSSETGGAIIKGTMAGNSKIYRIRSCFGLCSIAIGAREAADESRITRLELDKPIPEEFDRIKELWAKTVGDPHWITRFVARCILKAAEIREAAEILTPIVARTAGDSRTGQQYGAIAAGYWLLVSDSAPSQAEAESWAGAMPWATVATDTDDGDDAHRCLAVLLESKIDAGHHEHLSVGELLHVVFSKLPNETAHRDAKAALLRHGIHIPRELDAFNVANRHQGLSAIYRGTPYASNWRDHLLRLKSDSGAEAETSVFTPTGGTTTRSVRIPREIVAGLIHDETQD